MLSWDNGISENDLTKLIQDNIEMAHNVWFDLRATMCDQGTESRKAYTTFGGTSDMAPYNIKSKEFLAFFDVSHLFKSIRNNLIVADICNSTWWYGQLEDNKTAIRNGTSKHHQIMPKITDIP